MKSSNVFLIIKWDNEMLFIVSIQKFILSFQIDSTISNHFTNPWDHINTCWNWQLYDEMVFNLTIQSPNSNNHKLLKLTHTNTQNHLYWTIIFFPISFLIICAHVKIPKCWLHTWNYMSIINNNLFSLIQKHAHLHLKEVVKMTSKTLWISFIYLW
jgi:hypothetical protein